MLSKVPFLHMISGIKITFIRLISLAFFAGMLPYPTLAYSAETRFQKVAVDIAGPIDPWGKSVGDINGDGRPDIVVGGHHPPKPDLWRRILNKLNIQDYTWPEHGELYWYESPNWQKHLVSNEHRFRTDHEVADIDADGKNDILSITDAGLFWFQNPGWTAVKIDDRLLHDVEIADFDNDGDLDAVARNQQLFGHADADRIHFYRQDSPSSWTHFSIESPQGEGLAVADMDGDSKPDVIGNQYWYRNPGELADSAQWAAVPYCSKWTWPDVFIDIADINSDGKPDVLLAPAEPAGKDYHLSWCESLDTSGRSWREHIIDPRIETVVHSIRAGDFNNDGHLDVVSAEMVQGQDPDEVAVYWNRPDGRRWEKEVLSTAGSHSMRCLDFDRDNDLDIFGANWTGEHQAIELWVNQKKK